MLQYLDNINKAELLRQFENTVRYGDTVKQCCITRQCQTTLHFFDNVKISHITKTMSNNAVFDNINQCRILDNVKQRCIW